MSVSSHALDPAYASYLRARTVREDEHLAALREAAIEAGIPEIHVSEEQAAFQRILLRLAKARRVFEVGTLGGYSALAMVRALPEEGRLETFELDPHHARFAREWLERAGEGKRVTVHEGDARQGLAGLESGVWDAGFVDADKDGYLEYLEQATRLLRPGGLLMVDNAFAFGQLFEADPSDPDVVHVRDFNEHMARHESFESIIIPLGDGCWVGVRV